MDVENIQNKTGIFLDSHMKKQTLHLLNIRIKCTSGIYDN